MKAYQLLMSAMMLCGGMAAAAWDDGGYAAYTDENATPYSEEVLVYDEPAGVDPMYSTPSINSSSAYVGQHAFVPNDFYFEYLGKMSISGPGGGALRVTNAFITMPFTNPKTAVWRGWHLDAKLSARFTHIHASGSAVVDEDRLYTVGMNVAVSHAVGQRSQVQIGFTPQLSTDFDVMSSHNFFWGGYVAYSSKVSDRFQYTLGLAFMPDFYEYYVFPVLNVRWRYAPTWEMRIQASRLSAVNVASERFQWGPFFQWNSGVWNVHRKGETQQFRMTNCIMGMGAEYNMTIRSAKLQLMGDLGMTFNNTFRVRDKHGDDTLEKYRTHPGLYARLGIQLQF